MSKLLKAVATKHRPHIAARMEPKFGYDESKHILPTDLHKAGIVSKAEADDLDGCNDDLADSGSVVSRALQAISNGKLGAEKANDQDFVNSLMAIDSDTDNDGDDPDDDSDEQDDGADSLDGINDPSVEKVTA